MTSFIAINNHGILPTAEMKTYFSVVALIVAQTLFAPIPWACFQCLWKIACLQSAIASQLCENILELYFM